MARQTADDDTNGRGEGSRRSFLKTVGLAVTAAAGTAIVGARGSAATTIDLGEKGLSRGDSIDPYLEENFTDGNEVHIPPGEYEYTGSGLGGDKSDCALIGSPEGVTFKRPGQDETIRPTIWAMSGTVRIENITVKGKRGQEQSRWRAGAAENATVDIVNVNMPDGTVDGSDSTGIYAGTDHAGTLKIRYCYFSDFGNVACYVSDPYAEGDGKVIVEDCNFVNTGMSALRLAPDNSEVRRCYFEATEKASSSHVGWNQRGIKIDDPGTNVVVEDCDFNWDDPGRTIIKFDDKGEGGEGVMRNLRIANNGDDPTFSQDWSVSGNWTGENIQLTGSGDQNVPDGFETVTGSDAEQPNTEYEIWTPEDSQGGSDSASSDTATETAVAAVTGTATQTATGSQDNRIAIDGQTLVQAERGTLTGDTDVRTVHDGYTGDGFVDLEPPSGSSVTWSLDVASAGRYDVRIRYSSGDTASRTANLVINGETRQITFEPTGGWSSWTTTTTAMTLVKGENDIRIVTTGEDAGQLDTLQFSPVDSSSPGTETPGESQSFDKVLAIDGTGDVEETARYTFSVSGDVARDDEHSEVRDDSLPWDGLQDRIDGNSVVGVVGNGVDAYGFSGSLTDIDIRGKATFTIIRS